jgi:hypothetical protein
MTLTHSYITAPVDVVEQAWRNFASEGGLPEEEAENVHFIPAEGGCFLVTIKNGQPSKLSLIAKAERSVERQVAHFREEFKRHLK